MRLRWVFTDRPFLPVGTGCVINNRIWNRDQITRLSVGQVPPDEARFKQDARWHLPLGILPGHMCRPEWLATGEPWPTELPPVVIGPDWIPACCFKVLHIDATAGGLVVGGEVGDVPGDSAAGGLVVGGEVDDYFGALDATAGGLVVGGAAGDHFGVPDPTAGGLVVGGEVGDVPGTLDPTAGGLVVGGSAGDVPGAPERTVGGLVIGGRSGDYFGYLDATAGGLVVGGEVGDLMGVPDPTAGGLVVGGEAGDEHGPASVVLFQNGTFDPTRPDILSSYFFGEVASQQFTLSDDATITQIEIYAEVQTGEIGSMFWDCGATAFGTDVFQVFGAPVNVSMGVLGPNGLDVWKITLTVSQPLTAGTYWLTLADSLDDTGFSALWFLAEGGTVDAEDNVTGTVAGGMVIVLRG